MYDENMFRGVAQDMLLELRDKSGSYSAGQAAGIASCILRNARLVGYSDGDIVPIVRIMKLFGIMVSRADTASYGIGVMWAGGRTREVYKSDVAVFVSGRQRFAMAYLFASYLFDYIGNLGSIDTGRVFEAVCPENGDGRDFRASRFASALLMPVRPFARMYNEMMERSNSWLYTVLYLSLRFDVDTDMVSRRVREILYGGGY